MTKKVYFNHDGGVDDLVSLFLLLQMENVHLIGVSTIGADCYLEPSLSASIKIINRFSNEDIQVAPSYERGKNPFPKEWRMHAFFMDALPILNEPVKHVASNASDKEAFEDIIQTLKRQSEKSNIIVYRPAYRFSKSTTKRFINRSVYRKISLDGWYLFYQKEMFEEPEHDGSAEWNAYWDPEAVKIVFDSDIEIDMVALESTNQVPLTLDVRQRWANERQYTGIDFLGVSYAAVPPLTHFITNSTYFLWDVLTTAYIGNKDLVHSIEKKVDVISYGPSQGKTFECKDGRKINVINHVDNNAFFNYITALAKKVN